MWKIEIGYKELEKLRFEVSNYILGTSFVWYFLYWGGDPRGSYFQA